MKYIYAAVFTALILTSCKKMEVESPQFEVQLTKLTYNVNDTVKFGLSGNVENIVFYSGERGFRYANKNEVTIETGKPELVFTSALAGTAQANSLKVLVTTNLVGNDAAGLLATNWTDITSSVTLATNSTTTNSGTIDLSTYAAQGTPFVLAFKYNTTSSTVAQPTWVIRSFNINGIYPDNTSVPLATLAVVPWASFNIKNPAAGWTTSATELRMAGSAANTPENEDWITTGPINLKTSREIADFGLSIQNIAGRRLSSYEYIFKKAGTYKVTLVGFNNNIDVNKEVVKEFEITVTP